MKKKIAYSIIFTFLLSFTGCQLVFRKAIGFKKEKYSSPNRIKKFANKYGIDSNSINCFQIDVEKYWESIKFLEETNPDLLNDYMQPVQIRLYDEEKLNYGYLYSCNVPSKGIFNIDWQKTGIFNEYPPGIGDKYWGDNLTLRQHPKNPVKLTQDLAYILDMQNNAIDSSQFEKSNYVVLIYWSITGGRQSRNLIEYAKNYAQKHNDKPFSLIYINVDNLYTIE